MRIRCLQFVLAGSLVAAPIAVSTPPDTSPAPSREFLTSYCITCHNQRAKTAGLMLDTMDVTNVGSDAATWEKAVVKLRAGLMPPAGARRPPQAIIDGFATSIEAGIDCSAGGPPDAGRHEHFLSLHLAVLAN